MEKTQKNYSFKGFSKGAVFFDLETTGLDVSKERIVQLAVVKINIDGSKEEKNVIVNPTIPIPKEASDVHGITDEMVKYSPEFKQVAKSFYEYIEGKSDTEKIQAIHKLNKILKITQEKALSQRSLV